MFLKVHWLDLCSDLYVKCVSMHRVHWYPTERAAVALAVVVQPLCAGVVVDPLLMYFTWYPKVLLLGHLWGTFE